MEILYFLLAVIATVSGGMAGIGGGIIIKPVLDAIGRDSIQTISILSSVTVFTMSLTSMIKHFQAGFRLEKRMLYLALGAIVGGIAGRQLFEIVTADINMMIVKGVQSVLLAILLIIVLFKNKLPDWEIKSYFVSLLIGVYLGTIASFLGIGGGPINVAILCMVLAMTVKDAAIISVLIILFSQGAKLLFIQIDTGFGVYDGLSSLFYMIPGGIIGGFLGTMLNRRLSHLFIERFFMIMIAAIIALNIYNSVISFLKI